MSRLNPDLAPQWLRPAMGVDAAAVQERIGNRVTLRSS